MSARLSESNSMRSVVFGTLAILTATGLSWVVGCTRDRAVDHARTEAMAGDESAIVEPRSTMPGVMQSKLAHAQAILDGMVLSDFDQVRVNAGQLYAISEDSQWLVHETPSYVAYSQQFQAITRELMRAAAAKDGARVSEQYQSLVNSCVACHTYLREERPTLQMPGRVSLRTP